MTNDNDIMKLILENANWDTAGVFTKKTEVVNESTEEDDEVLEEGFYELESGEVIFVDDEGEAYEVDEDFISEYLENSEDDSDVEDDYEDGFFHDEDGDTFYQEGDEIYAVTEDVDGDIYLVDDENNIFEVYVEDDEIILEVADSSDFEIDEGSLGLKKAQRKVAAASKGRVPEKDASDKMYKYFKKQRARGKITGNPGRRELQGED